VWHFKEKTNKKLLAVDVCFGDDGHSHQGKTEFQIA
jgi:hypothetical protein